MQMNNNKQRHSTSNEYKNESKGRKIERINKPFAVVNGQTLRSSISMHSYDHQYSNDENQFHSQQPLTNQAMKRKFDSSILYHHQTKRFHSGQTIPMYPTPSLPSESFYSDHSSPSTQPRISIQTTSRHMLLKNDPSLADTISTAHMPTNFNEPIEMIEGRSIYQDDIEHLLDIFKNEVEMIELGPKATTSISDYAVDFGHCLSSNEYSPY